MPVFRVGKMRLQLRKEGKIRDGTLRVLPRQVSVGTDQKGTLLSPEAWRVGIYCFSLSYVHLSSKRSLISFGKSLFLSLVAVVELTLTCPQGC